MGQQLSTSIEAFALDLLRVLSTANPSGNILFSPLSISSDLATVYMGAAGATREQMAKALSFSFLQDVKKEFKIVIKEINSPSMSYILKLASQLYADKTINFLPAYLEELNNFYQADVKKVNFQGSPEESRAQINSWVEQHTDNEIKDLLNPGTITSLTSLVVVNAVYFNGNWLQQFDARNTKEKPFKVNQNEIISVQMMSQIAKFPINNVPAVNLQILELPYAGKELSMFILLPEESTDGSDPLQKLVKELTRETLDEWTSQGNMVMSQEVMVHLPKFKLEQDHELIQPLRQLGMTDVFTSKANLSGMSSQGGLFLSVMPSKSIVAVNEKGDGPVGALAAMEGELPAGSILFNADHPFLFFIRHKKSNCILFLGLFYSPPVCS